MELKDVGLKLEELNMLLVYIRDTLNALNDALNSDTGSSYAGCIELLYYASDIACNDCDRLYDDCMKGGTDNV